MYYGIICPIEAKLPMQVGEEHCGLEMKIVFANVIQGFVYAHHLKTPASMIFSRFSLPEYANYFRNQSPDILCLSEVLIDDKLV